MEAQKKNAQPQLEFFWSARTLRCDRITEEDGIPMVQTEDVLGVDQQRSIFAYGDYGPLIVRLLNEHFAPISPRLIDRIRRLAKMDKRLSRRAMQRQAKRKAEGRTIPR